jgi:hypothetical protein
MITKFARLEFELFTKPSIRAFYEFNIIEYGEKINENDQVIQYVVSLFK